MKSLLRWKVYFELADVSGDNVVTRLPLMRLCVGLETKLKNSRVPESHLQQIDNLCAITIEDENCFFMSDDTWLIITVSLKDPERFLGDCETSFGLDELTKMISCGEIILQEHIERVPDIIIRRNVLPSKGIWKELQESHNCSYWAKEIYSRRQESVLKPGSLKQHSQQPNGNPNASPSSSQVGQLCSGNRKPVFRAVDASEIVMVRKLGKGARGIVWQVVWGNSTYAMKFFDVEEGSFATEKEYAESGLVLDPHIVQVFGQSCYVLNRTYRDVTWREEDDRRPCLLMELMDYTLKNIIYQSSKRTSLPIPPVKKLDVLLQVASAVQKLHDNNVVHGDLKPGNVLVTEYEVAGDARHFLSKVADFDGARRIAPSASFVKYPCGGTTQYAAPEVLRCRPGLFRSQEHQVDSKSDVYSFGVVAFEILTEHWAWGRDLEELKTSKKTDLEKGLREVALGERKLIDCEAWSRVRYRYLKEVISLVESCLEKDPMKRPNFSEICEKLSTAKSDLQNLERIIAAIQKFVIVVVAVFVLSRCFHYASAALITVLVVATSTWLTGNWTFFNPMSTLLAQTFVQVYREVLDRLAWRSSPKQTANRTHQSSSGSSETE